MRYFIHFLVFVCSSLTMVAQNDGFIVGDWQAHLSYNNITVIEPAGNRIYAGGESGFFYYDQEANQNVTIDKSDGMSDLSITALHFVENLNILVIGYENGNIDLLMDGTTIFNINNIKNSSIQGKKQVNDIMDDGRNAFLACGFGVVKIDLVNLEIAETYKNIGQSGEQIEVYNIVSLGDTLYASTEVGMQKAVIDGSVNLLDFNSWYTYTLNDAGVLYTGIRDLAVFDETVIMYRRTGGFFYVLGDKLIYPGVNHIGREITQIETGLGSAFISYIDSTVYEMKYVGDSLRVYSDDPYFKFHQDFAIQDSTFWFGHRIDGLISLDGEGKVGKHEPNGLASASYFRVYYSHELVACTAGGYDNGYVQTDAEGAISFFNSGRYWNVKSQEETSGFPYFIKNLVSYTYNPIHKTHYLGTFNSGLITWDGDTNFVVLNENNSLLTSSLSDKSWVKTPGLFTDHENNTWISNHEHTGPSLFKIPADTTLPWDSYVINEQNARYIADVKVDESGLVWCLIGGPGRGGMMVFRPSDESFRYFSTDINNGGLPNITVGDFDFDRDGDIWMGTAEGVAVFRDVESVLDNASYNAELPIFEGRPLLQDEIVTSVAIDGGNRKWFGTTNGVFLFNEDVSEILAVFNEDNSPLLSNSVSDIVVNEVTGEVFFATDRGVSSYWSDATLADDSHSTIKIFPNPVPDGFEGVVSIQGLAQDAIVKITDVSGNLVKEMDAEGGMATWDLRNIDNEQAATGVYLVYSLSQNGDDSFVGKIVIN